MKPTLRRTAMILMTVAAVALAGRTRAGEVIERAAAGYPTPHTPYYHYRIDLKAFPEPSLVEIAVAVNGVPQRFFSLCDAGDAYDESRPAIRYRPAFADTYTINARKYRQPRLVGWLAWRAGETYRIEVKVRLKKELKGSDGDRRLAETVDLAAPAQAALFGGGWRNSKALVLTETAGIDRKGEPVEVLLSFYADEATTLARDLRVASYDPDTRAVTEVPSQVYDIRTDAAAGDPREPNEAGQVRQVQIWVPTVTAWVAFRADVPARASRIYFVYHNNPAAEAPRYASRLAAAGPPPGLAMDGDKLKDKPGYTIENDAVKIVLHKLSGVLDEVTLKSRPATPLVHHKETNGGIHWIPEAYPPPRPWVHASDWKEPRFDAIRGPVVCGARMWDRLPYVPEIDASISYKVFEGQPYILATTSMRVNRAIPVQAMRNGEVVFERSLLTHLAWYDVLSGTVKSVDLREITDLDQHLMEADVPWLTFYNPATGIGFGGVQLEYANAGVEEPPRVWNPHFYVIVGPIIYWARAMNFTFAASASQLIVEAPQGSVFWEKWAYLPYETAPGTEPWAPMAGWHKRLTNPLRVRLVEEVENRVPTVGTEIYIDPTRTGWEDRETRK